MANELRFDGRVAIITGAGNGLGRAHALLFGSRGAKVVVNDLGGSAHGGGKSSAAADKVVAEIKELGGEAVANYDSVEDGDKIVQTALDTWGRIDIVVNNAGILRDTSFQKMSDEDWELIYRVHVRGSYKVTKAAWNHMRDAGYGRIVMTASAAGIYGNFGQANYAMAKLGLVGFSNTLALEGRKKNVFVNTIAPIAGSRLTETVMPKELTDALKPEYVSPLVAWLCHEDCDETGGLFEVGGGFMGKLRWERSAGQLWKLGRAITPEQVKKQWSVVTSFEKTEHPSDINSSMQPILGNLNSKSQGGNEFIDVDAALGYQFPEAESRYDERDLSLYALGVGAAQNPLDEAELRFVYELHKDGFAPLPTYAVIPALNAMLKMAQEGKQAPGLNYGFERVLHGEQYTEVKRPLPPKAKLRHRMRIKDILDKGKNAVVVTEIKSLDESGREVALNEVTTVVRGAGGWGGDRGPQAEATQVPSRAADAVVTETIHANQALLYRLSGDWNPLHADPSFAGNFGFEKPILHGLCTFGYAGRHVLKSFAGNDPRYFKSIRVRFADTVFPGETLKTEMWREEGASGPRILFQCKVEGRNKVVISGGVVELYKELPKEEAPPAPKAAASVGAASAASTEPTSGDIFAGITEHVKANPNLASQIQTVFHFKLTDPASAWTLDLKNGQGVVVPGTEGKADCTLELSDADFIGMSTGKLNPQKLYFGGKLKIGGNVMASQKLEFLKSIDPQLVIAAMKKRIGGGGEAVTSTAPAGAQVSSEPTSADVFVAIRDHVEKNAGLVGQIGHVFQFKLTAPDSVWTVDLKNGKGAVAPGTEPKPDCTLELSDADFMAMVSGKADPQKLYFGGKLKIGGNVMASQKLTFLKEIKPEDAKKAVEKARAAGTQPAAAAPTATSTAKAEAPAIEKALADRIAKTPALVGEVGGVITFVVREPDHAFTVDLKSGGGALASGKAGGSDATITIADSDFADLVRGKATARELYQQGKLRVDGDVRLAHRLGFLKNLI
jgi:3-hydroxyacyl-CoA dehydrogenase/3a,7a,12a-trihydroxy-5b-cholest-24-enoyl-CoA hydratase